MTKSKRDRIAARAYEIWESEGRPPNKSEEHWRKAEQEVARQDRSEQMGAPSPAEPREAEPPAMRQPSNGSELASSDPSDAALAPDVDTPPARPVEAAPALGGQGEARKEEPVSRPKPKSGRSRRPRPERQQD